jgi:hypothetical protein
MENLNSPLGEEKETSLPTAEEIANSEQTPAPQVLTTTPVENVQSPAVESPATEPESEAPEAETTPVEEDPDEASAAAARAVMTEVLQDVDNLENVVAVAPPKELLLLLDAMTHQTDLRNYLSIGAQIKKQFTLHTDEGHPDIDTAMQGRFTTLWAKWNKRRVAFQGEMEEQKKANTKRKYELLDQLRQLVDGGKVNEINKVREIQNQWRETGWVQQSDVAELSQSYKALLDRFYSLRAMHHELMDLDRKHNLEEKTKLLNELKTLAPAEDVETPKETWNTLTQRVRQIQDDWKQIGHVPKENADELNEGFRNAVESFYGIRSKFFEEEEKARKGNEELKKKILEEMKPLSETIATSAREWNLNTAKLQAFQEEWRKIGPATHEENKRMWKEFRAMSEKFFKEKSVFFKSFEEVRNGNLAAKTKICEEAESLKDSTDWNVTSARLRELQEEWKKVGPVQERHATKLWKRFRAACDHFFDRRKQLRAVGSPEEMANMEAKQALIAKLKGLTAETDATVLAASWREVQETLRTIGHVPYKLKDKLSDEFKEAREAFFAHVDGLGIRLGKPTMEARISNISNDRDRERTISGEMSKLQRALREAEENLNTYQTNILYISKGKSGDALRAQIQKRIDQSQEDVTRIKAQIKELRRIENGEPAEEKPKAKVAEEPAVETPVAETPTEEAPASEEKPAE